MNGEKASSYRARPSSSDKRRTGASGESHGARALAVSANEPNNEVATLKTDDEGEASGLINLTEASERARDSRIARVSGDFLIPGWESAGLTRFISSPEFLCLPCIPRRRNTNANTLGQTAVWKGRNFSA